MKKNTGFTLIELMIVVGIISIISAVALPSYRNYVMEGRRSAAQQVMLDMANRQEQYILDARQYTATLTNLNLTVPEGWSCSASACSNNFYSIAATVNNSATPPSFNITATAQGDQTSDGNLGLTSTGSKSGTWD